MKTWKDVTYKALLDESLMSFSWKNASKGKRKRSSVKKMNLPEEQFKLMQELRDETYVPKPCRKMRKYDKNAKKWRDIACPAFRDQIVHWMIVTILKPHFESTFIKHNIANIENRGLSYGNKLLRHWSQERETKYVLKMDIKKYYPSINISILIGKLRKKIRDVKFLNLIEKILYTESPNGVGLTLGSYLNLWLALFLLDELDHKIKEEYKIKHYLRYVDDMLILTKTKRKAKQLMKFVSEFLKPLKLKIKMFGKGKAKIYKWTKYRFIDMLGTKTYRNKQILRKNIYLKIRKKLSLTQKHTTPHNARSTLSYKGVVQYSSCIKFYDIINKNIINLNLKKVANL